ncbi:MAG: endonuclease/exonuclease/phosphatase family protein [Calditrichaeota bacterium]|nr:MAG: endonuclease/exonuclease/phosphatase family protein [Calditrichota bacterium]
MTKSIIKALILILLSICSLLNSINAQNIRLALFNIKEMSTEKLSDIDKNGIGQNEQLRAAAAIIEVINADILVLNEIDHDYSVSKNENIYLVNINRFESAYLKNIHYKYIFAAPCNTGHLTGFDLNNDGLTAGTTDIGSREHGDDCYGWGTYPGQYSMAVLSKYPISTKEVRTFQKFLWHNLPGHHMPEDFYSNEERAILRLSSKSHWDVPVRIDGSTFHLLVSHPTPPVFDGPEDRNGRRNFDEIKFWKLYLNNSAAIYDDSGHNGGYANEDAFAIIGDLNASIQSDSRYDQQKAIEQLLKHPRIQDSGPAMTSGGARKGISAGPPDFFEQATTEFRKGMKRRIDYILPSKNVAIIKGGVFWPDAQKNPVLHQRAMQASDHRLIWLDVEFGR